MKLALKKPVQLGEGLPVSELILREEITAGDLRGIKLSSLADPQADDMLKIAARLSGQPDVVIGKLCLEDFGSVVEAIRSFL